MAVDDSRHSHLNRLHQFDCCQASENHNIFSIHQPAAYTGVLSGSYLDLSLTGWQWNAFVVVCALLCVGGHISDLHSLPSAFTQSVTFVHFSTRPPYFVCQYLHLLMGCLTCLLERMELEVWSRLQRQDTGGGISYHGHQKCLVGSHSLGLGKINQTAPDNRRPRGSPLPFPHPSITLAPRLSRFLSVAGFIGEETENRKPQCGKPLVI